MDYPVLAIMTGAVAAGTAATLAAAAIARAGFPLPADLPASPRAGCVDGLRGYLALSVLAHHFVIWLQITRLGGVWAAPSIDLFNQFGAGAVGLFFMTTGFVFYPRVLAGFRASPWPSILVGRVFRIVPLLAASVAVITLIIALRTGHGLDGRYPKAAWRWITAQGQPPLLGDPDAGRLNAYVLWSLRYEWIFYLAVLPACALAMDLIRGRIPSWVVPVALLVGSLIVRIFVSRSDITAFLPLFSAGMLAYECRRSERIACRLRAPAMTVVALCALVVGMSAFPTPYSPALPLLALFFACVACGNDLFGLLRTRGALVLGEVSYGIYLLHGIVLSLLFVEAAPLTGLPSAGQLPFLLPLSAIAVVLAAAAAHLAVERPAIRLGRRFAARMTQRRTRTDGLELEPAIT